MAEFPGEVSLIKKIPMSPRVAEHRYRRVLPPTCLAFASEEGITIFKEAINGDYMNCYFNLASQFRTQEEPAYCGLSTLVMVLNSLFVDPGRVWKGPWRWFHENMLDCCVPLDVAAVKGITLLQFHCLARCNGLDADMVQATEGASIDEFRAAIKRVSKCNNQVLVSSYSRVALDQSGDGHFSPLGGYHAGRDMVLIFDVARFKYPPHWIPVQLLWKAMQGLDKQTGQPRGYMVLKPTDMGNPPVLFQLSKNFSLTLNSPPKREFMELAGRWSAWLLTSCDDAGDESEFLKKFVFNFLGHWHHQGYPEYEELLIVRVDERCCAQLSDEHNCAICELLKSIEKLSLFHCVESSLRTRKGEDSGLRVLQETPSSEMDLSCCLVKTGDTNSKMPLVTRSHIITMVLLSWPYETSHCTDGGQITKGDIFLRFTSPQLTGTSHILESESALLRRQLATVMEFYQSTCECNAQTCS